MLQYIGTAFAALIGFLSVILIISANPLFREVIQEIIDHLELAILEMKPDEALTSLREVQPDIIILDEAIDTTVFQCILSEARSLSQTRTIIVNPRQNEVVFLDSRKAILSKTDELKDALISNKPNLKMSQKNFKSDEVNGISKRPILLESWLINSDGGGMDYTQSIVNDSFTLKIEQIQVYSELYGLLAQFYNQIPDRDLVKRLRELRFSDLLRSLEDADKQIYYAIQDIQNYISKTIQEPEEVVQIFLAKEWTRLFRGVSPTYGPPPPYEAEYIKENISVNQLLAKLNHIYHENAVEIQTDFYSRPDYIGVELDFVRVLLDVEAVCLRQKNLEKAAKTRLSLCNFMNKHLIRWVNLFVRKAITEAQTEFYRGILKLTETIVFDPTLCDLSLSNVERID